MIKPMLAYDVSESLDLVTFPKIALPKIDGIRGIVRDGVVYSRSGKPIPNKYVHSRFRHLHGYEGELVVGEPFGEDTFARSRGPIMSKVQDRDFRFCLFDRWQKPRVIYEERLKYAFLECTGYGETNSAFWCGSEIVKNLGELQAIIASHKVKGYEGTILRDPLAEYSGKRSTVKTQDFLKIKHFKDDEGVIVGFEPLVRLDRTVEDLVGSLRLLWQGKYLEVGSGLTETQRRDMWVNFSEYKGKLVTFKYMACGTGELPRHPVFKGVRDE